LNREDRTSRAAFVVAMRRKIARTGPVLDETTLHLYSEWLKRPELVGHPHRLLLLSVARRVQAQIASSTDLFDDHTFIGPGGVRRVAITDDGTAYGFVHWRLACWCPRRCHLALTRFGWLAAEGGCGAGSPIDSLAWRWVPAQHFFPLGAAASIHAR
jgi:hypothetical protein